MMKTSSDIEDSLKIWELLMKRYDQQSNNSTELLFNNLTSYGLSLGATNSVFETEEFTEIFQKFKSFVQNNEVLFFSEYGSAIIFRKQQDWKQAIIDLVFPVAWNLGSEINKEELKMFAINPQQMEALHIGRIDIEDNLKQFVVTFNEAIHNEMKGAHSNGTNKSKNHHTPSWLYEILLTALQKFSNQNKKTQNKGFYSKGGTLDVGNHTGTTIPNTAVPIAYAIIKYIIGEGEDYKEQYKLFELSYRLNLLLKISQKESIENNIHQLRSIIQEFKVLNSHHINYSHKNLCLIVKKCMSQVSKNDQQKLIAKNKIEQDYTRHLSNDNKFTIAKPFNIYNTKNSQTNSISQFKFNDSTYQIPIDSYRLFSNLLSAHSYDKSSIQWILLVEKALFGLANNYFRKNQILSIQVSDISEPNSYLIKVLKKYEDQMRSSSKYYIGSTNEKQSLIFLVKLIGCIIAFQVIKRERMNKKANLNEYRIPFDDYQIFFNKFSSMSYEAREAMQSVYIYLNREKEKKKIFVLEKSNQSYLDFAIKFYDQSFVMSKWLKNKQEQIIMKKKKLAGQLHSFQRKIQYVQKDIKQLINKPCSCQWKEESNYWNKKKKTYVQCSRCKRKKQKQKQLQQLQSVEETFLKYDIPESQHGKKLYAFLSNIPSEIVAMIKIFNNLLGFQKKNFGKGLSNSNAFSIKYQELAPCADGASTKKFLKYLKTENEVESLETYSSSFAYLQFEGSTSSASFDPQKFNLETKNQIIKWASRQPDLDDQNTTRSKLREHEIYSKIDLNRKFNLPTQQFVNLCSVRVSLRTQLPILCSNLLSRKIVIDIFKTESFQLIWEVIIRTSSSLRAHKFDKQFLSTPKIIQDSINQFLNEYHHCWNYTQINSLIFLGPFMSLFSKYFNNNRGSLNLLNCAYKQFNKLNNQLKEQEGKIVQIRARQAFISFSALCCLTQQILNQNTIQQNQLFVFFIVLGHSCTVFMNQNRYNHKNSQIMNKFSFIKYKSIFKNLPAVLNHFKKHPNKLNKIVKNIDQSCIQQTKWEYAQQIGYFAFRGTMKIQGKLTEYIINIETGVLLKNGKELTGLSYQIKSNKYFKQIFGERDFQVYHTQNSCRTKRGFKEIISISPQEKNNIFFQFKQLGKEQVQIKMIQQKFDSEIVTEEEYLLIEREKLKNYQFSIHPLFLEGCLAWHCENKKCIIFRKPKLEQLESISMIIFLDQQKSQNVRKAILISNQCKKKKLTTIMNMESSFEQIIFRTKHFNYYQLSLTYKIISQIEDWQYVIQLKCKDFSKFWLHRYSLTFRLQKNYLIPEGYGQYAVCQSSTDYCPWPKSDNVRSIWLQKTKQNLLNSMKHSLRIIIPNLQLNQKGLITLPTNYDAKIEIFQYDLHQHFNDIRGQNSQANLHLASIMISRQKYRRMKNLSLTLNQYCQSLIRSCYNLRPLTSSSSTGTSNKKTLKYRELQKIKSILYHSSETKNCSVLLCCQVLLELSKNFQCLYKQKNMDEINVILKTYKSKFSLARHNYTKIQKTIGSPQKLNQMQKEILGLKLSNQINGRFNNQWKKNYPLKINLSVQSWIDIQNKINKNLHELYSFYREIFNGNNQISLNKTKESELRGKITQSLNIDDGNKKSLIYTQMIRQQSESMESSFINLKKNYSFENIQEFSSAKIKSEQFLEELIIKKREINLFINQLTSKNVDHIDILSQKIPKISSFYYTNIICQKANLRMFYPDSTDYQVEMFCIILKYWMILTVEIDSLRRLKFLFQQSTDKKAIRRELLSPRKQIEKFTPWICFQAQMRIKIWASQYETYKCLNESSNRSFSQLNMGEGKTQVIIPMFVLDKIFNYNDKSRKIPRINLLSSLLDESRSNYYRFFTATSFKIPCIEIPFNRGVDLSQQNLKIIKRGLAYFGRYFIVLSDRESCLSMILKIREMNQNAFKNKKYISQYLKNQKQKWLFGQNKVFDILDEVDALVTPKKSFVYAIGGSTSLPEALIRIQLCRFFLEILVKEMLIFCYKEQIITCDSFEELENAKIQGRFPRIRYIALQNQEKKMIFRQKLIELFLSPQYLPETFSFYQNLNEQQKNQLKKYLTDEKETQKTLTKISVPKLTLNQIFAVRGIIAFGILQHCLSLRCGVEFGVPGKQHPKRVAVPYQAADVPSKRSEYAHPDVATILSYICRYIQGLSYEQFKQCMNKLSKLTLSSQKVSYSMWLKQLKKQVREKLNKEDFTKLDLKSKTQMDELFFIFKSIRPTIAFWLNRAVFPTDLRQYNDSITSSSWDIANSEEYIGFSGTKDSRWVFPAQLKWLPSHDHQIKGTDGRNIALLLTQTQSLVQIKQFQGQNITHDMFLWQKFLIKALEENVSCIIDAGAILVGKSIQHQICNWIGDRIIEKNPSIKGITFPNKNGKWIVYDFRSKIYIDRGTKIAEHQTFVIFDEARTRGSDIKMSRNVCAALTLAPNMTKDKFMQAMGRLRKIEAGQTIKIFATTEVLDKIEGFSRQLKLEQNIKTILKWLIRNSVRQNEKYLFHNNKLAWIHFRSINLGMRPYIQTSNPELQVMYNKALTSDTPFNLNNKLIKSLNKQEQKLLKNPIAKIQFERIEKYGDNFKIKCQGFDDVCERQVELVQEVEQVEEKELCLLTPLQENDNLIKTKPQNITTLPFQFDQKIQISYNFRNCTNKSNSWKDNNISETNIFNELMYVNFVQFSNEGICLITQRQANTLLRENLKYINPKLQQDIDIENERYIMKFQNLTVNSRIISLLNLTQSYVDIKFYNGEELFPKDKILEKEQSQYDILRSKLRNIRKNKRIDWQMRLQELTGHFLQRRRTLMDKYQQSSLEKLCTSLKNDKI